MLKLLSTLSRGITARTADAVTDHFSIELVQQKIRESEGALENAKHTLASLIVRQRKEKRMFDGLERRISDCEASVQNALEAEDENSAREGAAVIVRLEKERTIRRETLERLSEQIDRMRNAIDLANQRIIELKQGFISAQAVEAERRSQQAFGRDLRKTDSIREAEQLINRIMDRPDPFEHGQIMDEIDQNLSEEAVMKRMADAGYHDNREPGIEDVINRLKKKSK